MPSSGSRRDERLLAAVPGRTIPRQVLWLSGPVFVEQTLLYLVGLSDTVLTGRYLSREHLAAVTVASYLMWFLSSLMAIVSVGATALVARLIGGGDRSSAVRIAQQAVSLALLLGVAIVVLGQATATELVRALQLRGMAADEATRYLRIVLLVAPLLAVTTAGIACLRGAGDTRTGMWVMTLVNAINVGVSWSLVRGWGPVPALGFTGIALGTACGEAVGGLVVLAVLARGRSGLGLSLPGMIPSPPAMWRLLRISLPAAGENLSELVCQLWFLGLINRLGATATAAHGVAIRCEAIAFLTVTAFAVSASTLTGQYLGAGRPDLAARAAHAAWRLGIVVLSAFGVLFYTQAPAMFALFLGGGQPEVAAEGVPVLRLVAFAMPALATISVLGGALRGAGDTRWPWLIVLFGFLTVRLPLTYALTGSFEGLGISSLGLYGAWVAMVADLVVRGLLIAARFAQGGWRRVRV